MIAAIIVVLLMIAAVALATVYLSGVSLAPPTPEERKDGAFCRYEEGVDGAAARFPLTAARHLTTAGRSIHA